MAETLERGSDADCEGLERGELMAKRHNGRPLGIGIGNDLLSVRIEPVAGDADERTIGQESQ